MSQSAGFIILEVIGANPIPASLSSYGSGAFARDVARPGLFEN